MTKKYSYCGSHFIKPGVKYALLINKLYTDCDLSGVIHLDWFDNSLADKMKIDKKGTKQLIGDIKAKILVSVHFIFI